MGLPYNPLEVLFAGKGIGEHLSDPTSFTSKLGLPADALGLAQMFTTGTLEVMGKKAAAAAWGTPIIGYGLLTLNAMQALCGIGNPNDGSDFTKGAAVFKQIHDSFDSTAPTDDWAGEGSETYAHQNQQQQKRAGELANVDADVQKVVNEQAAQVTEARNVLDISASVLTFAIPPALAAQLIQPPPVGQAIKLGIEIGAVAGSVPRAGLTMDMLGVHTLRNAGQIQNAINKYNALAADAAKN